MSVTSQVSIISKLLGDVEYLQTFVSANNTTSPAVITVVNLTTGNNTITVPTAGGTATAVLIIPPAGNTNTLTIKGDAGDTGVSLHRTNPSLIGLNSVSSFILTTGGVINNTRFIYT